MSQLNSQQQYNNAAYNYQAAPQQQQEPQRVPNTALNQFMGRYQKVFEKQKMPSFNMALSLFLLFLTPLVFEILTQFPQAGTVAGPVFYIQVIFSIFGMHGCDKKERWSLLAYQYSCPVFSLTFIFLSIKAFVEIGHDYYSGTSNVLFGFAGGIYILLALWMVYSYVVIRRYTVNVEWMQDREEKEKFSQYNQRANVAQ